MDDNYVSIVGRLVKEPEFHVTKSGGSLCALRIAYNDRRKDGDEWVDGDTWYYDVTCFKQLAERAAELPLGCGVRVTGRLVEDSWTNDDGETRRKHKILANTVEASVGMVRSVEGTKGSLSMSWGGEHAQRKTSKPVPSGIEDAMFGEDPF